MINNLEKNDSYLIDYIGGAKNYNESLLKIILPTMTQNDNMFADDNVFIQATMNSFEDLNYGVFQRNMYIDISHVAELIILVKIFNSHENYFNQLTTFFDKIIDDKFLKDIENNNVTHLFEKYTQKIIKYKFKNDKHSTSIKNNDKLTNLNIIFYAFNQILDNIGFKCNNNDKYCFLRLPELGNENIVVDPINVLGCWFHLYTHKIKRLIQINKKINDIREFLNMLIVFVDIYHYNFILRQIDDNTQSLIKYTINNVFLKKINKTKVMTILNQHINFNKNRDITDTIHVLEYLTSSPKDKNLFHLNTNIDIDTLINLCKQYDNDTEKIKMGLTELIYLSIKSLAYISKDIYDYMINKNIIKQDLSQDKFVIEFVKDSTTIIDMNNILIPMIEDQSFRNLIINTPEHIKEIFEVKKTNNTDQISIICNQYINEYLLENLYELTDTKYNEISIIDLYNNKKIVGKKGDVYHVVTPQIKDGVEYILQESDKNITITETTTIKLQIETKNTNTEVDIVIEIVNNNIVDELFNPVRKKFFYKLFDIFFSKTKLKTETLLLYDLTTYFYNLDANPNQKGGNVVINKLESSTYTINIVY